MAIKMNVQKCHEAALEMAIASDDGAGEMLASGHLGLNATTATALTEEEEATWEGGAVQRRASVVPLEAIAKGREALERQLELQTADDDPRNRSVALTQLGMLSAAQGEYAEAAMLFQRSRQFSKQLGDEQVRQFALQRVSHLRPMARLCCSARFAPLCAHVPS